MKTTVESCVASLVPLSVEECVSLLRTVTVGRLIYTERALPAIMPVYVAVDGAHVLLRSVTGASMGSVVEGSVVALEAGAIEPPLCRGWTVTVTGRAFSTCDATRRIHPFGVDGCEDNVGGEQLRLEAGLVSGHYLCHRLERGSSHPCLSGTSQMTSTPPEGRSSTPQLPPS